MPSQAALERGAAAAKGILKAHRQANNGTYPETVAVSASPLLPHMSRARAVLMVHMSLNSLAAAAHPQDIPM